MSSSQGSVRQCSPQDIPTIYRIINEAAKAYRPVLPSAAYHEPQMTMDELRREIERVLFLAYDEDVRTLGVMGYEFVKDVALIRHAYVLPGSQRKGVGSLLLNRVEDAIVNSRRTSRIIIGTYTNASWAVAFYRKHGYRASRNPQEILVEYYDIPEIQRVNSLTLEKRLT